MALATERKEQVVPLFNNAPIPEELDLSEIVEGYTDSKFPPAFSIKPVKKPTKEFSGDTSIEIDNREQQAVTKIRVTRGKVTQIEQRYLFSRDSSQFAFYFGMSTSGDEKIKAATYGGTLKLLNGDNDEKTLLRYVMRDGGVLSKEEVRKEEEFGLPHCPDVVDLRYVLTNVFAGEFVLAGIWNPF